MYVYVNSRPLINSKVEEKTCGEGPSLECIFEDDAHLSGLCQNIQVDIYNHNLTLNFLSYTYMYNDYIEFSCSKALKLAQHNIFGLIV